MSQIRIDLACAPPNTTAQQKRVNTRGRRPVFYHGKAMQRQTSTWISLLRPHVPAAPLTGPVVLTVVGIWPHPTSTPKRDRARLLPKTTKPDASNFAKHLEDLLVRMRFLEDDSQVSRCFTEKWRGPAEAVGIRIFLATLEATACPSLIALREARTES